jgi:hypothetical protein
MHTMNRVADHYEGLLAEHYSWMFGVSAPAKAAEQRDLLVRLNVAAGELGVDLGAGAGFQSMRVYAHENIRGMSVLAAQKV